MPELPEVETVRRTLAPLLGETIVSTWGSGKALRLGRPVELERIRTACAGAEVAALRRLGKFLLIDLGQREHSLLVHLGMSGRLRHVHSPRARAPHTHLEWTLKGGGLLRYSDPRRFGSVELVERGREREHPSLRRLGPDPLEDCPDPELFFRSCRTTRRPIKVALLDQSLIAGVGNIYASEALWQARIHPSTPAARLRRPRTDALLQAIGKVLHRALEHGGTSLKDFVAADGQSGSHAHYLWVYDREHAPCPRPECGGSIRRTLQQQRATFYCPRCQH